jgi:putative FmdB family regulatory protein
MPLYEYQCKKCSHRFEKIQKFSDRMVKKCPECGGVVEQMISAPAVQFKGSGWYVTDYAKKSSSPGSSGGDSGSKEKSDDKSKSDNASKDTSSKDSSKEGSSKAGSSKESSSKEKETPRRGSGRHK